MTIDEFLSGRHIASAAFAERVGATRQAVARWRSGERIPSPGLMVRIVAATAGAVTPNDFFDIDGIVAAADGGPDKDRANGIAQTAMAGGAGAGE